MENATPNDNSSPNQDSSQEANQKRSDSVDERVVDPMDLVYKGGFEGNPRDIVENPAVAPQMLESPTIDARASLMTRDQDEDE
ncbi:MULTISPECIES: hypothetical protein [unclassified Leptolyngbya]|uniref:hypothetical protein n=1 Tax=unclassified Leptolyngbya TaxID=2650499 RepID=UPI0016866D7B|nr:MULTISPECIES: hypothetical protein [unclassified Leptolyngbya]MBD1912070.1 hypothetical protein [Leptolyngbya sp. FACHB-8]MBD2153790.1 hypothetical protein [Leptolyngbya sp. FACHB-16]